MSPVERGGAPRKKLPIVQATSSDKTALPEVLPEPRRDRATSAPRARTLAHMRQLLALGAAVGVASISCGKSNVKEAGESRGCGKSDDESSSGKSMSGGDASPYRPFSPSSGYAVVDPMPKPAHRRDLAPVVDVEVTAREVRGVLFVAVKFSNPRGRPDFRYVSDAKAVVMGGSVLTTETTPDGIVVNVSVDSAAPDASTYLNVAVKGTCNDGPTTLSATITWSGPPATTKPLVTVDQY